LSRVIHTESPSTLRKRLLREIATVLQSGKKAEYSSTEMRDMIAFIAMTLKKIDESVEQTTAAWEKRGYWLKADRFRLEWSWVGMLAGRMEQHLELEDIQAALPVLGELAAAMTGIQPKKGENRNIWKGAWKRWKLQND